MALKLSQARLNHYVTLYWSSSSASLRNPFYLLPLPPFWPSVQRKATPIAWALSSCLISRSPLSGTVSIQSLQSGSWRPCYHGSVFHDISRALQPRGLMGGNHQSNGGSRKPRRNDKNREKENWWTTTPSVEKIPCNKGYDVKATRKGYSISVEGPHGVHWYEETGSKTPVNSAAQPTWLVECNCPTHQSWRSDKAVTLVLRRTRLKVTRRRKEDTYKIERKTIS